MKIFRDWDGQQIAYRMCLRDPADPHGGYACEIDPHGDGQWIAFGVGHNRTAALGKAIANWNAYDQGEPVQIGDSKPEDNLLKFTIGGEAREED